jgi:hypothetical protein
MGQTVVEVVKVIAPIALKALAAAAEALVAGKATADAIERLPEQKAAAADQDWGEVISTDTWQYIESNFGTQYGYYYQGLRSQPANGALPIAAAEDIIVWEEKNNVANIQSYLQTVFKDSLAAADSIELAQNLGTLFQTRFNEQSLGWTPFSKRYNFSDKLTVDTFMVTASAHDVDNKRAGVASYCFVAYNG